MLFQSVVQILYYFILQRYTMLHGAMYVRLYDAMLYYIILYYATLQCTILCCTQLHDSLLCCTTACYTMLQHATVYYTKVSYTIQYYIILNNVAMRCRGSNVTSITRSNSTLSRMSCMYVQGLELYTCSQKQQITHTHTHAPQK